MLSYVVADAKADTVQGFFLKQNFQNGWIGKTSIDSYYHRVFKKKIWLLKWLKIAGGCQKVAPFAWIYPPTNRNLSAFPAELSCLKCPRCNSCTIDPPTVFKIKSFLFCTSTEHISQMYIIVGFWILMTNTKNTSRWT